jgi:hypothetical protein
MEQGPLVDYRLTRVDQPNKTGTSNFKKNTGKEISRDIFNNDTEKKK